jgi:GntR family transcriptional regulator, transcriptional repressor for pyruvate dehydrogenase complex
MSPRGKRDEAVGSDDVVAEVGSGDLFAPVTDRRISELIVDQVRLLIRGQQLNPGDRLPAERELCERFGVSRVTVREALRVLEANGLLEIRVGARGGAFVTKPSREQVGEGVADLLTLSAVTAAEAIEARLILEVGAIPLICARADDADIADLLDICDRQDAALSAGDDSIDLSAEFHARLAECARNAAVAMLSHALRTPMSAGPTGPAANPAGAAEHRRIVHAVQNGDPAGAAALMRRHLSPQDA